jgi:hypothetical protein
MSSVPGTWVELKPELFDLLLKKGALNVEALKVQVGGSHYKDMVIQPVEYIVKNDIPFREGNVIKYITRWKMKDGLKDLKKAAHFLNMLIEEEELRLKAAGYEKVANSQQAQQQVGNALTGGMASGQEHR